MESGCPWTLFGHQCCVIILPPASWCEINTKEWHWGCWAGVGCVNKWLLQFTPWKSLGLYHLFWNKAGNSEVSSVCFVTPVRGGGSDLWGGNSHGKPWIVICENRDFGAGVLQWLNPICVTGHRAEVCAWFISFGFRNPVYESFKEQTLGMESLAKCRFCLLVPHPDEIQQLFMGTHQALQLWDEQRISRRGAGNPPHHTGPGSAAHTSVPAVSPHPFLRTEVNSAACLGILSGYPNHLK